MPPAAPLAIESARRGHGSLRLATVCLCLLAGSAGAGEVDADGERYEGIAHASAGGQVAYRETHWRYLDHGRPARLVLYRCANGSAFARKRIREVGDAQSPDFDFIDGRDGYREGVRSVGGKRQVYWQENARRQPQQREIAIGGDAIIDAGFDAFVRSRWTMAAAGEPLRGDFLLPSRHGFLPVRVNTPARKAAEDGLLHLSMKLDAWYGFVAPETRLVYRRSDRRLLSFEGIGSIRDARGKHQAVRLEYPPRLRVDAAPMAEVQAALALPLASRCPG